MEIATLDGEHIESLSLPASPYGIDLLKARLAGLQKPVRLAVSGTAALGLALALGQGPVTEVFIVSSAVADQPVALAQYAERAI